MKLNVKALAFVFALVWAGAIFVTGLVNLIWPGYGEAFLQMVGSIYPGYSGGTSFLQVLLGRDLPVFFGPPITGEQRQSAWLSRSGVLLGQREPASPASAHRHPSRHGAAL